ncbi:YwqH-like family protein [Terribacillus saccharophilus]|uniref:YwqH-like family protein n=1 Tax=Terribacillus saccharophilus TaxID=361277 RepID=UPI002989F3B4|nr:DUF5082 family protein [Terribacillus saccharophilus]MCM3226121.1 DUF5082 domain-containing protein [Terribacillus saccharophilus]
MTDNSFRINLLNNNIDTLSSQISINNEKLEQLRVAFTKIASGQEEFMSNKRYTKMPELTSTTWAGRHADTFQDIRQEINNAYSRIGENDIEAVLSSIEEKIDYYTGLNRSFFNEISNNRQRISELKD